MMPDLNQVGQPTVESIRVDATVPAVMLDHVTKFYGHVLGLNDVSLAIGGGVTGILGQNHKLLCLTSKTI